MNQVHIYIISLLLSGTVLQAQHQFNNYKHLTVEDGLPRNGTSDFAEDKYGFIWMATTGGLVRYDGSKVIRFEKLLTDSTFLPSHFVASLLITGDSLWIGTKKGLSILNLENRKLTNHLLKSDHIEVLEEDANRTLLQDIYEDRQGNVWLAPAYGGFVKWDKRLKSFIEYPMYPDKNLPSVYLLNYQTSLEAIIQDVNNDSIMWGASRAGLIKLNTATGEIKRILYNDGHKKLQFDTNRKLCIYQDEQGIIYSGSLFSGLSIYDPGTSQYFLPAVKFPKQFPSSLNGRHLFTIMPGDPGYLYLTYINGLYLYNTKNHTFQLLKENLFKGEKVDFGIDFIDSKQRLWSGSRYGVVISDPIVQQFNWYSLADLNPTDTEVRLLNLVEDFYLGYISVAGQYADGLYHINTTTGHSFKNKASKEMIEKDFLLCSGMSPLDDDNLLFSAGQILYTFNKKKEEWNLFETQVPIRYDYLQNNLVDQFNTAWIGTRNDGLYSIDLKSKKITSYEDQIPHPFVDRHFEDSSGNIWMTTGFKLMVFNRKQGALNTFSVEDSIVTFNVVANFCECPNGEVWTTGKKEGIGLLSPMEPERGIIQKIKIKNKNGDIIRIDRLACNQQNELWAISSEGLSKINTSDSTSISYNFDYGVKGYYGTYRLLESGELFIGSGDGFYTVNPNRLFVNTILPKPYVVSVFSNKELKNKLEDYLNQVPVFLKADENVMTIEFSSINHTLSQNTKYRYMLEGIDEDWIDPGEKRSFTYSYLPGGNYICKHFQPSISMSFLLLRMMTLVFKPSSLVH